MPDADITTLIAAVLRQAPAWVKSELASNDAALQERAADALAAMIAAALVNASRLTFEEPTSN